ncbi:unnamed protein product [Rhizophagus irregularis]|nr:unnamed protein product [Rhizophagus irregularis]
MSKSKEYITTLISPGKIVENLHFGPFCHNWWLARPINKNPTHTPLLPIRLGMKTHTVLKKCDFIITVVKDTQHPNSPGFLCFSEENRLEIEDEECVVQIYTNDTLIKTYNAIDPDEVWLCIGRLSNYSGKKIFGLENPYTQICIQQAQIPSCTLNQKSDILELRKAILDLYPSGYEINEREWRAWRVFVRNAGCTNITPFKNGESKFEFWTKSDNAQKDSTTLQILYKLGFLQQNPCYQENQSLTFWQAFRNALENTNRGPNGQRRILSIIATKFTYQELRSKLGVSVLLMYTTTMHAIKIIELIKI